MSEAENIVLRSFVEQRGEWWDAICIDLDISAQGKSHNQAKALLDEMVATYLESVGDDPPDERRRLLRRKSPIFVRSSLLWRFFVASLFATRRSGDSVGFISHLPCPV